MKNSINLVLLMFVCQSLFGQLNLIPYPTEVKIEKGVFVINKKTVLDGNPFLFQEINETLKEKYGFVIKSKGKANIKFEIIPENSVKTNGKTLGNEGYLLNISPKQITIYALTEAGLFYGAQTLKQLIYSNENLPCLTIYDKPDFKVRAWQDDISRGPIPTMDVLKEEIRTLASYKLNYFSLYIEHVFKLEKHPTIAPKDGITQAEIEELTEYAKKYHVKLVGSFQSLGHMVKILSLPEYQHLAENEHVISPAFEESYTFLDEVYKEIVPAFGSEYFNINCDETFGLGEGPAKPMLDSMGIEGLYAYHINRLDKLLKPYGSNIIMWADIVDKYKGILDKLPKDITLVPWAYHPAENFIEMVEPIEKTGLDYWVAPGINCWGNFFPNYGAAEKNINNFIRDGFNHNAKGVLNTSWDDGGLNFAQNNWHGFIWGAENSWNATKGGEDADQKFKTFNQNFDVLFYGLKDNFLVDDIIEFSGLHQRKEVRDMLRNNMFFEPVFPIPLEYVEKDKKALNEKFLAQVEALEARINTKRPDIKRHDNTIDYLLFAINQSKFLLKKNLFRIDVDAFIKNRKNIEALKVKQAELLNEIALLKNEYVKLWNLENRPLWLVNNTNLYENLEKSLKNIDGYSWIEMSPEVDVNGRRITIKTLFNDKEIVYRINNEKDFRPYTQAFYITQASKIEAKAVSKEDLYASSKQESIFHKGIGKLYKLNTPYSTYNPYYDGGGKLGLLDGVLGEGTHYDSGKWQAYGGNDIDVEIDLGTSTDLNELSIGFYQNTEAWIIYPKTIEIFSKNKEEENYKLIKTIVNTVPAENKEMVNQRFKADIKGVNARFIRVKAQNYGKLPEWHAAGSSYDAMLFADEIIVH